jgi:hypothetical protein
MIDVAKATAAPIRRLESLVDGGIELHPFTMKDWGTLDLWLRESCSRESFKFTDSPEFKAMPPQFQQMYFGQVIEKSNGVCISNQHGASRVHTFEGMLKLIEISARGEFTAELQAAVKEKDMKGMIEEVGKELLELSSPPETISDLADKLGVELDEENPTSPLAENASESSTKG